MITVVVRSQDVADAVGVSRATVSQILNGRGQRFSEETRARVLQAAADMDYQPSVAARTLATGTSDIIVAFVPLTTMTLPSQLLLERTTTELAEQGITLVMRLFLPTTKQLQQVARALRPRAVLTFEPFSDEQIQLLGSMGIMYLGPTATDQAHFGFDVQLGQLQAEHLIDGRRTRLAFVALTEPSLSILAAQREEGFRTEAAAKGVESVVSFRVDLNPESLAEVVAALPEGCGVGCYNDDVAIALLGAAHAQGRSVPNDLALIGVDSTPLAACTNPPLSSIGVDIEAAVFNMTANLRSATTISASEPTPTEVYKPVEVRVVARASTGSKPE